MIKLDHNPLNIQEAIDRVSAPGVGGIDVFIGTVRDATDGKKVVALEFEAYEKMAISELQKIIDEAGARWNIHKISIIHALGRREPGELAVVIAVSAAHRDMAFAACRYVIDSLKKTVPIWKKEIFEDGEIWVNSHP